MPTAAEILEEAQAAYEAKRAAKGGGAKTSEARKALDAAQGDAPLDPKDDVGIINTFEKNFANRASGGILPWIDEKMRQGAVALYGEDKVPESMRTQIAKGDEQHPIAAFAGGTAGTMLPFTGAAKLAQGAGITNKIAQGALAGGGANLADQAIRSQTEDREVSPSEVAISAGLGGVGPAILKPVAKLPGMAWNALMDRVLGPTTKALGAEVPAAAQEAAYAARQVLDKAAASTRGVRPPPTEMAGPPIKPAGPLQRPPTPEPPPIDPLRPRSFEGGGGRPFTEAVPPPPEPPPIPEPRPINTEGMEAFGPKPLPFQGIRPSKLERGSPLWEELGAKIRGEAPPLPPKPAEPPKAPGLLDLPLIRLGTAAGYSAGEDQGKRRQEENKRRRKKGMGLR